ncbi:MAG: aminotransferase class III-fold pyridoxal phosphate-dependent enzyme [Chloroflexota bacterium]
MSIPPNLTPKEAADIAQSCYGLTGSMKALPSERDQNFRLTTTTGGCYVLKIANSNEDPAFLDCQNEILHHLNKATSLPCFPTVKPGLDGQLIQTLTTKQEQTHLIRLLTFLPGKTLAKFKPHSPHLFLSLGETLGEMDRALQDFHHPSAKRDFHWDLQQANTVINQHKALLTDPAQQALLDHFLAIYNDHAMPSLPELRTSVIHSDANDYNVLVALPDDEQANFAQATISGLIDFGDLVYSHTINELAIACAYGMQNKVDPIGAIIPIVQGYHQTNPLTETEIQILFPLICMRICTTVVMARYQRAQAPDNEYLSVSEAPAWALLAQLHDIPAQLVHYRFRDAVGLPPCPATDKIVDWLATHPAHPITDLDLRSEPVTMLDLSIESVALAALKDRSDTDEFTEMVFRTMSADKSQVGIGLYNEARQIYTSALFDPTAEDGQERRTIHLGLDLFMIADTPIYAPFDGRVHSFANNEAHLDYGPTIILEHKFADEDIQFYTLYGHLSLDSLTNLRVGRSVKAGDLLAHIGTYPINGDWPPHLHFQIIVDLLGRSGEFPGVALASQRNVWRSLCPDPNLIVGIPSVKFPQTSLDKSTILEKRRAKLGKMLSVSYQKPLKIVRGARQYLYDETGHAYLDGVNNVCHVGHCHPQVVAAGQAQMAVLNTNTRYLHDHLVTYAERLTALFPDPLNVCFLVCSGSEANELALRLAKTHTQQKDMIIVDGAYHGNTSATVDISPYKFDGPGGTGTPDQVHKALMPDPYRGPYKGHSPETGAKYATHIQTAIGRVQDQGRDIAGFICESVLGCGGQIVLPDGYLKAAFSYTREAGGVCIADEVQVGFGRVGSHFWGFETQGVVPDIVTMGKPIGNGHPMAAVVTTAEIAASFNNGMEYFNTFGGNPVSCAIGMAVLDVIEQEKLQSHAAHVGQYLLDNLTPFVDRYDLVGDVRGLGLFIGIELVLNRKTLEPAPLHASYIVERMRDHNILLSTDGPYHNVLKFKPPLVFSKDNADLLIKTLDQVLQEDVLRL